MMTQPLSDASDLIANIAAAVEHFDFVPAMFGSTVKGNPTPRDIDIMLVRWSNAYDYWQVHMTICNLLGAVEYDSYTDYQWNRAWYKFRLPSGMDLHLVIIGKERT